MSIFHDLFLDNPMMAEVRRVRHQSFSPKNWRGSQAVAVVLLVMLYVFFALLTISYGDAFEPVYFFFGTLTMLCLVIPMNLHGVISGEREKRSLDMLLVAPVTVGQIVVAKLARAVVPTIAVVASMLVLAFISALGTLTKSGGTSDVRSDVVTFTVSLALSLGFAFFLSCMTLFVSSLFKNNGAALLCTIGALFGMLVVLPAIVAPFFIKASSMMPLLAAHPFLLQSEIITIRSWDAGAMQSHWVLSFGIAMVVYLGVGMLFLKLVAINIDRDKREGTGRLNKSA